MLPHKIQLSRCIPRIPRRNLRAQFKVGASGGIPAHRPSRYRGVGPELEFVAEQAMPVSYTHLDVYKRQCVCCATVDLLS